MIYILYTVEAIAWIVLVRANDAVLPLRLVISRL
jgi:hypothetical protein